MDPKNTRRQPVPAGGAPIPSAIEAADATPPAGGEQEQPETENGTETKTETAGADDGELVEARVLIDHAGFAPNDVLRAPSAEIDRLKLAGVVDPHPDAVAHAKGA